MINVVAAVIKNKNLYLIAQRNRNKHLGLKWEFPGGKVEKNETFHDALIREIREELNVDIHIIMVIMLIMLILLYVIMVIMLILLYVMLISHS